MSIFKRITGAFDHQVSAFTKILQQRRSPLQIGPGGTAQGILFRVGLTSTGNAASPEAMLSLILKEWVQLRRWPLDTQLSVIESRALGNKYIAPDGIASFEQWLQWRLPLQFPEHTITPSYGWTPEFFEWATKRAIEHFV